MEAKEMTIRTLVNFEQEVTHYITEFFRCSNGDAQGISEAHQEFINNCYKRNDTPRETAKTIFES